MNASITTQPSKGQPSKGRIDVRNFGLSYPTLDGPVEAVCDASIHVNPGEFVSIVGPSGCGKSTLLNAVAGFLKPTAPGSVRNYPSQFSLTSISIPLNDIRLPMPITYLPAR